MHERTRWLLTRGRQTHWAHLVRDCGLSALALVFSFWSLAGSGYQAVYYGLFCLLLGLPVYIWLNVGRREDGETPVAPADAPTGLTTPSVPLIHPHEGDRDVPHSRCAL